MNDNNKYAHQQKSPLGDLGVISRFYGSNKSFVIAGGGNTSYKTEDKLWVKASGYALASITEEGFAVVDRKKLEPISEKSYSSDSFEREAQIKDDLMAASFTKRLCPSSETLIHNLINFKFVVHLHPTLVNGVMCSNEVENWIELLFGSDSLYVPYAESGYNLYKAVELRLNEYQKRSGYDPNVILLQNHGIFVSADSIQEIIDIYDRIIPGIKKRIINPILSGTLETDRKVVEILPAIRALVSSEGLKILKVRNNPLIDFFTNSKSAFEKIRYPLSLYEIMYSGSEYIYLEKTSSPDQTISEFKNEVEKFINRKGQLPKIILIKGVGMVAIGENASETENILDAFEDSMKVSWLSESFGGPHFLSPAQVEEIEKVLNRENKVTILKNRLENKITIVTGAAQGFGEGIARGMKQHGSNIVVADLNETVGKETAQSFNSIQNGSRAIFVKTDVTNFDNLSDLVYQTVCEFGGLDVLVSNAGILRAGSLEEMTPENFDLVTKINYNAYFYCVKAAVPVMKLQNKFNSKLYADIIQINSKSGLSGSKMNFAYSGGKFGGIGLTQSFALELAPERIKVNAICPGNFYEGPLWSDPDNGLFVQYLKTGKVPGAKTVDDVKAHYLSQVPMGKGCTPEDVVKAVLYAIEQENETGQAIPVTGGQIMMN